MSSRGVFQPRRVRLASFGVTSVGLLFATVITLLAIWNRASIDTAWRSIATLGVLVAAALLFNAVNAFFGERADDATSTPGSQGAPTLPNPCADAAATSGLPTA